MSPSYQKILVLQGFLKFTLSCYGVNNEERNARKNSGKNSQNLENDVVALQAWADAIGGICGRAFCLA